MELIELRKEQLTAFKKEMQEAFQRGYEDKFGKVEELILPENDIMESLNTPNAIVYEAVENDNRIGGAIIALSNNGQQGDLHFLYTKPGYQNRGIATFIWNNIETLHPEVKTWDTRTPYFEVKNVHFYVNRCGFHIVEFFNSYHPDSNDFGKIPATPNPMEEEFFFRFEKRIY